MKLGMFFVVISMVVCSCYPTVSRELLATCKKFKSGAEIAKPTESVKGKYNGLWLPYTGGDGKVDSLSHTSSGLYVKMRDSIFIYEEEIFYYDKKSYGWINTSTLEEIENVARDSVERFLIRRNNRIDNFKLINCF